jgi:large subunit ribosomal protein L13
LRSTKSGTKRIKVNTLSYKTVSASKETVEKEWYIIDARDQVLGRLASVVAMVLRGKHKPSFTPHADTGDSVIVINADKVRLTGNKMSDKQYVRHSGYPGGQITETPRHLMDKRPEAVVEKAVKGMLPKNRLGSAIFRNLYVYASDKHPHEAQQPKQLDVNKIK